MEGELKLANIGMTNGDTEKLELVKKSPSIGCVVHYRLTEEQAKTINDWRRDTTLYTQPQSSTQPRTGNYAAAGEALPLIICKVRQGEYGPAVPVVNGQVMLDGNDQLWVTSAKEGPEPGQWMWPKIL